MNTQPPSQHEVLSDEEQSLALVVRALPGGDPPAALDALILRAASNAVASRPEKNTRWAKGWLGTSALWLGTAAASVLTLGIGWQVFQSMRAPIYELPDSENVRIAQGINRDDANESLIVEMTPAREPLPISAPPPMNTTEQSAGGLAAAAVREKEGAVRREMTDAAQAKKASSAEDKMRSNRDSIALATAVSAPPPPPPAPVMAPAPAANAINNLSQNLESVTVTGSRLGQGDSEARQAAQRSSSADSFGKIQTSIDEDAKLAPALWLDAVKDRVKRNDIEGAKASLKLYKQTHPKLRIPEELKFLLK